MVFRSLDCGIELLVRVFADLPDDLERRYLLVVLPPCLTAIACLVLFFYADAILALIEPIAAKSPVTK